MSSPGSAEPRPSSSVILLRPSADGPEVFMVLRNARSDFAASVFVFPGGSLRADDLGIVAEAVGNGLSPQQAWSLWSERGATPPDSAEQAYGLVMAAARELFEEAGVLLAREADGSPLSPESARRERLQAIRPQVERGEVPLPRLLAQERLNLDWQALAPFSHWITPRAFPIRFTTRFFLARLPEGQEAHFGARESTEGWWIRPEVALQRNAESSFPLVFATAAHLKRMCGFSTLDELLHFALTKPIRSIEPTTKTSGNSPQPELSEEDQLSW